MISRNDNPRLLSAAILIKRIGRGNGELRRDDWKLPPLLIESGAIKGKIMSSPASPGAQTSSRHDFALFLLRIASAAAFLYHGSAILFGAFAGPGPQNFAAYLHVPVIVGYLVGLAQVAGGLAILTGVLFRVGAACVIIVMIGAIFLVHISHGFDVGKNGFEYAFAQLVIAFSLLLTGPGGYSLAGILPPPLRKL
jgi:putative oxidoreductase